MYAFLIFFWYHSPTLNSYLLHTIKNLKVLPSHLRLLKVMIESISSILSTSPFMNSLCPQYILYFSFKFLFTISPSSSPFLVLVLALFNKCTREGKGVIELGSNCSPAVCEFKHNKLISHYLSFLICKMSYLIIMLLQVKN